MRSYTTPMSLFGAALVLAGAVGYLLNPEAATASLANLSVGAVLVVIAGVLNPDLLRQYARWLNAFWGGIMVLGIVVMVNFLADRYPQRADLTEGKLHSLSPLTVQTLERLDTDVEALAFVENGEDQALATLLEGYATAGSRFEYEIVDPDRVPGQAEAYAIRQYGTVVIEADGKRHRVTDLQEKEITNAILKVTREQQDVVYLTVGHGEAGLGSAPQQLGILAERLRETDYTVRDSLFIARETRVPDDCAVLIIAGPRTPFLANEVDAVRDYLQTGGAVLALVDPLSDPGLAGLLQEWGVALGDDFVIDTSGIGSLFGLDYTTPVASSYGEHPITAKHAGVMTFYQLARSVQYTAGQPGLEGAEIVSTSKQGWAESDLSVLQAGGQSTVSMDDQVDRSGPIALGVAVGGTDTTAAGPGRLVVFGDSDFITNQFFDYQGNGDLALNAISWLSEDEALISIRPRQAGHNPIALTEGQGRLIFWVTVVLMPLAVTLAGVLIVSRKGRWSLRDLAAAGLGVILSLGVVAMLNFLGDRYHYRVDLTEDDLFTLDPATVETIEPLARNDQLVHVKVFASEIEAMRFKDLLEEYQYRSRSFSYEVLDPQKNALQVKQYGIRQRGTAVVEVTDSGQLRTERITEQTEEALTNAIRKALAAVDLKVYCTTGHGEGKLDDVDGPGFSILRGRLREMNVEVAASLKLDDDVPDDASAVAVIAPTSPFSVSEVAALRAYLQRGGRLLVLADPGVDTGLEELLQDYGVVLGQDFVVDLSGIGQMIGADVSVPVVLNYADHPVTEKVGKGTMSFFPLARSVAAGSDRTLNPETERLLLTHQSSWAESDLGPLTGAGGEVEFDPGEDKRGPIALAMAATADADTGAATEKARLVVFGDADFATNQYFGQQANGQLVVGSVNWLTETGERLTIARKQPRFNPINLVGNAGLVVLWISVFVLPFAVALSGLVMAFRRGASAYTEGGVSWVLYTYLANALFLFITAVVRLSESQWVSGELVLLFALLTAASAYGLQRRLRYAWEPALAVALASAVVGFWIIPQETIQLVYAAVFVVDAAILVWIRKAFQE